MATHEITQPRHGRQCGPVWCGLSAVAQVIIPREMVSQTGGDDPLTDDRCGNRWDELRGQLITHNHKITDITASVEQFRAEFHGASVFCSGEGVLYAAAGGRTYHVYLASQLRGAVGSGRRARHRPADRCITSRARPVHDTRRGGQVWQVGKVAAGRLTPRSP